VAATPAARWFDGAMLDAAIRARLTDRHGERAGAWLDAFPAHAAAVAARWQVTLASDRPPASGSNSVVLHGWRDDGEAVVLKLLVDAAVTAAEGDALALWGGDAATSPVPRLLARDDAAGALLLEAIAPGEPVRRSSRPLAPTAVGRLLRALRTPTPPPGLPPLRERVDRCFELCFTRWAADAAVRRAVPAGLLERGHALARRLSDDPASPCALVHGDLHPGNVLDSGGRRGLVAIDPRPCVGDPLFDAVDLTLWGARSAASAQAQVAAVAAEAGADRERLAAWCAALAAMAAASLATRPPDETSSARVAAPLALAA
jgi:streptomycin 6-kinase